MANDYKNTMNLPKTDFPMRAKLAQNEPKRIEKWEQADIYGLSLAKEAPKGDFILHDGPPYANGPIHIGHAMNKILKDMINRFWSQQGYRTPYVPGWDCHGQPIEHKIEEKLGSEKFRKTPQPVIRRLCREYAEKNVDLQRDGFKRLGIRGKWDDPYLTYKPYYEAADAKVFKDIYLSGAIYEGSKPVHWCTSCKTALAEAEIEYADVESPSIFVAFSLNETPQQFESYDGDIAIAIWTTTPWTLPANSGVALRADADYVLMYQDKKAIIVAQALYERVAQAIAWEHAALFSLNGQPVTVKGADLVGLTYKHPILEGVTGLVITGDHVELTEGTGGVHTSPGHGQEDYVAGLEHGLPIRMPVDDEGIFDENSGPFAGMEIHEANPKIISWLETHGLLLGQAEISHSYPHCWRCKNPVVFRATKQWFVSMDKTDLREKAMQAIEQDVAWYPAWASNRIGSMVQDRPDWCISRQRSWGVPIPVFHCAACGELVATEASFDAVIELFGTEGADAWFTKEPREYLPEGVVCGSCGSRDLIPESDILDVWWESGVSHTAVLETYPELRRPADMYLEGSDQHRGWFQSALLTSVAAYGAAPYKSVVSNGFINDDTGRKMSKSLGNVIDPNKVADEMGAEIIRLWVASTDTSQDVQISDTILQRTSDSYRRLRNTFRFLLSNLYDFDPAVDALNFDELETIDRWQIIRLSELHQFLTTEYARYRFHAVYRAIYDYVVTELSNVYLDSIKDRLYSDAPHWKTRRSAQTVLAEILSMMIRDLQPILTFTCDEAFEFMPQSMQDGQAFAQLLDWYTPKLNHQDYLEELGAYKTALVVRDTVTKALEDARGEELIGKSQEAEVEIEAPEETISVLNTPGLDLNEFFIVSSVSLQKSNDGEIAAKIARATKDKCPRCWNVRELGIDQRHPDVCERCARALS